MFTQREVADIRCVCGEKYQQQGTLSNICMPEEYRTLEAQGPSTDAGL
jgi:hypothetical protein